MQESSGLFYLHESALRRTPCSGSSPYSDPLNAIPQRVRLPCITPSSTHVQHPATTPFPPSCAPFAVARLELVDWVGTHESRPKLVGTAQNPCLAKNSANALKNEIGRHLMGLPSHSAQP